MDSHLDKQVCLQWQHGRPFAWSWGCSGNTCMQTPPFTTNWRTSQPQSAATRQPSHPQDQTPPPPSLSPVSSVQKKTCDSGGYTSFEESHRPEKVKDGFRSTLPGPDCQNPVLQCSMARIYWDNYVGSFGRLPLSGTHTTMDPGHWQKLSGSMQSCSP